MSIEAITGGWKLLLSLCCGPNLIFIHCLSHRRTEVCCNPISFCFDLVLAELWWWQRDTVGHSANRKGVCLASGFVAICLIFDPLMVKSSCLCWRKGAKIEVQDALECQSLSRYEVWMRYMPRWCKKHTACTLELNLGCTRRWWPEYNTGSFQEFVAHSTLSIVLANKLTGSDFRAISSDPWGLCSEP